MTSAINSLVFEPEEIFIMNNVETEKPFLLKKQFPIFLRTVNDGSRGEFDSRPDAEYFVFLKAEDITPLHQFYIDRIGPYSKNTIMDYDEFKRHVADKIISNSDSFIDGYLIPALVNKDKVFHEGALNFLLRLKKDIAIFLRREADKI